MANTNKFDPGGILRAAFDEATGRLKVDAQVTANISGAQEIIISAADDSIKIGDGTGNFVAVNPDGSINTDVSGTVTVQDGGGSITVDGSVSVSNFPSVQHIDDNGGSITVDGSISVSNFPATQAVTGPLTDTQLRASAVPISATSLPLPSGAATSANQTTANTSLSNIDTKTPTLVSGRVPVDGSGVTQPVSASSLPLPTGAATAANQTTGNTNLSSIDNKLSKGANPGPTTDTDQVFVPIAVQSDGVPIGYVNKPLHLISSVLTDDLGNQIPALVTYPVNDGSLTSSVTGDMTPASGDMFFSTSGDTDTVMIAVQGTWTGNIQVEFDDPSGGQTILSVREMNTGIFVSSIVANGVYFLENSGNVGYLTFKNNIATGDAIFAAIADKRIKNTGVWAKQAGTWTIGNGSGGSAVNIQDGGNSITVDATSLPLPSGASTAANQTTINTTLTSIKADLDSLDVTGSASSNGADVIASTDVSKYGMVTVQLSGTFSATYSFQGSNDNTNFVTVILGSISTPATQPVGSGTTAAIYSGPVNFKYFRVRLTAYTSGTVVGNATFKPAAIPYSGGQIVRVSDGTTNVKVAPASTAAQATDPSLVVGLSPNSPIPTGSNTIGAVNQAGTWTVQPGNTANTTPWLVKNSDGTNSITIKAASTAVGATDTAMVVAVSPNNGVSIGTSTGKTVVMKTGSLVTTAVTADQAILTYTVTSGKTFYLEYFDISCRLTTFAATATNFGNASLENPSGTKLYTQIIAGSGVTQNPVGPCSIAEPIPIASGTVIRIVCTPSATTSFTWQANFGGYEK